ncbi:MAG: YkgJ family cysteine cluster protein [Phycisphaerae bacterium]
MKLDVLKESEPWYADGLAFSCTQCGNCCTGPPGYVWISDVEIDRLAEYLKLPRAEVIKRHVKKVGGGLSLKERRNVRGQHDCVFLETRTDAQGRVTTRTCTVYPVRPMQCRTWPFWEGNLSSPEAWEAGRTRCPGMGRGSKRDRGTIEHIRDAKDWDELPG